MTKDEVISILDGFYRSYEESAASTEDPILKRVYASAAQSYDAAISWVEEIDGTV